MCNASVQRILNVDQAREQSARVTRRVDEFVGEQIRKRRTMLGLTQDQLAQALGISYQQVQKYETGTNRVSAGRLYDISRVLDSGVGAFFDGIEPDREGQDETADRGNRATIELVRNFQSIGDPQVRRAVSSLVKSLSSQGGHEAGELEAGELEDAGHGAIGKLI
jgi:transcriptional regulator with XRE-family HTH domain